MGRLIPSIRFSLGLASLTLGILFAALAIGFVPDRPGAILEGRKRLCETIAIHASQAAQRKDMGMIKDAISEIMQRDPDILSAAVRGADGELVVQLGEHAANWEPLPERQSTVAQVQVPIALADRLWGTIELRFRPLATKGMDGLLHNSVLPLLAFVPLAALLVYSVYTWLFFRQFDVGQSTAVPKRVRTTVDTLAEGVLILDAEQRIALANEAFAKIAGQSTAELRGRKASELPWILGESPNKAQDYPWTQAVCSGTSQTGIILGLQTDNDHVRKLVVNSRPIVADDGSRRGALATFDDLTLLEKKNAHLRKLLQRLKQSRDTIQEQNQQLRALATKDSLTACLNRRSFFEEFEIQWSAAIRYGYPLSCIMLDIDHFKSINDRHGHAIGDQVLQQVADALRSTARGHDLICRYGGEEFCILLPHVNVEDAHVAAERFRSETESRNFLNVGVTASFGLSAMSLGARDPRELLDQADKALYAAKRGGRNRVVRWDEISIDQELASVEGKLADRETTADVPIPFHAVTALVSALSYRCSDTAEHSRRVADLCVSTANGLLSQSHCYILEVAALLHDIGKLGVPDSILHKPGPLTEEEWKVMRSHAQIGEEIVTAAFTCAELTTTIRYHHAWYERRPGDTEALTGPEIPLASRILAIADAFDAMVSNRVYRPGRHRDAAFAELRRCAGTQFDPELVERFVSAVLARDENRSVPRLFVSKQTALQIGLQIEKLANALDAHDIPLLATMAGRLKALAGEHGITPIKDAAARLEEATASSSDPAELIQWTIDLLELCRSTYGVYFPGTCRWDNRQERAPASALLR